MDAIRALVDILLHVDKHLATLALEYGTAIYAILFVVLFCETGLVVTPFLPGDSLLFAAGAMAATTATDDGAGGLSMAVMVPLLIVAAVLGDAVNYAVGVWVGPGFLAKEKIRFIKREHLQRAQNFYEVHGGKAIILARFVPIVRTFAPFVAGIGQMRYARFALFNVTGAVAWVCICTFAGYFFGGLPFVKKNFELVVLGIIFVSVLPIAVEMWRARGVAKGAPST